MKFINNIHITFGIILLIGVFNWIFSKNQSSVPIGFWSDGSNVLKSRFEGTGAYFQDSSHAYLYFLMGDTDGSGNPSSLNDRYDVNTNTWQRMSFISYPVYFSSACISGNFLYVAGGLINYYGTATDKVQRYDIFQNNWDFVSTIPIHVGLNRVVTYQDSLIYSLGGVFKLSNPAVADIYAYNVNSDRWRICSPLPSPNCGFACTIVGDSIFVICGGYIYNYNNNDSVWKGTINQSDRTQITWSLRTPYPGVSRMHFCACPWENNKLICGPGCQGLPGYGSECKVFYNNNWINQPDIPYGVAGTSVGVFKFGNIFKYIVASGFSGGGPPYSAPYTQIYSDQITGIQKIGNPISASYSLSQNYPNPFNPGTMINFALPKNSMVTLKVYDIIGNEISLLINNEYKSAGTYNINFDGSKLSGGVYFYKITTPDFSDVKKMVLIK